MTTPKPTLPTLTFTRFAMFIIALLSTLPSFAAVVNVSSSMNWTAISTGSGTGGNPSSTDTVIVIGNNTILSINTGSAVCKSLVIGDGNTHAIEVKFNSGGALTVGGEIVSANNGTSKFSFTSGGVLTSAGFTGNNFAITAGTGEIKMTGGSLPAGVTEYYKLTLAAPNASDIIALTSDISVKNILEFNKGILSLGDYDLKMSGLSHTITAYQGSANSYAQINGTGRLIRSTSSRATLYPVGASHYSPVFLTSDPVTTLFSVGVKDNIENYLGSSMADHVVFSTWEITPSKNLTDLNLSLRWNAAQNAANYDEFNSYVVMRSISPSATNWSPITLSSIGGTSQSAQVSPLSANNTYLFGVGDGMAPFTPTPLPVEFISFTAEKLGENAMLNFATAWEVNNAGFEVERSTNGQNWSKIGFVPGKGDATEISNYTFNTSLAGINAAVVYYRLKQVDFNGQFEYSETRSIRLGTLAAKTVSIYPNPATSKIAINLAGVTSGETARISILDMSGKVLISANQLIEEGNFTLNLNIENLAKGSYIVNIASPSVNYNTKLVKF